MQGKTRGTGRTRRVQYNSEDDIRSIHYQHKVDNNAYPEITKFFQQFANELGPFASRFGLNNYRT